MGPRRPQTGPWGADRDPSGPDLPLPCLRGKIRQGWGLLSVRQLARVGLGLRPGPQGLSGCHEWGLPGTDAIASDCPCIGIGSLASQVFGSPCKREVVRGERDRLPLGPSRDRRGQGGRLGPEGRQGEHCLALREFAAAVVVAGAHGRRGLSFHPVAGQTGAGGERGAGHNSKRRRQRFARAMCRQTDGRKCTTCIWHRWQNGGIG
jgi:hypothetical protein